MRSRPAQGYGMRLCLQVSKEMEAPTRCALASTVVSMGGPTSPFSFTSLCYLHHRLGLRSLFVGTNSMGPGTQIGSGVRKVIYFLFVGI